MTTFYNRRDVPKKVDQIPAFLQRELEAIWRAFNAVSTAIASALERTAVEQVTASLANLAIESSSLDLPCLSAILVTIEANHACWVRLYTDDTSLVADAARAFGTAPAAGKGVLAEFSFTGAATIPLSPVALLSNDEATPAKRVWYAIQNRSGGATAVTVTLEIIPLETGA